jgi:hypothetical protein
MSYTLFKTSSAATDLIAQPGRAVNTFPSGLVRVDQTYLGLTANASTHRAILAVGNDMPDGDTSPCIDGLKIFPEVQERRREDGWTEYIVSAYGRVNSVGQTAFNYDIVTFSHNHTKTDGRTASLTGIYKQKIKRIKRVLLLTDIYNFSSDVSGIGQPEFIDGYDVSNYGAIWDIGVSSYESNNFGHVNEITVVVAPYKKIVVS